MDHDNKRIEKLENQLQSASKQLTELNKKIRYLERENSRRKTEMNQVVSALKRN
jgi:prefoldin subunit 5